MSQDQSPLILTLQRYKSRNEDTKLLLTTQTIKVISKKGKLVLRSLLKKTLERLPKNIVAEEPLPTATTCEMIEEFKFEREPRDVVIKKDT